MAVHTARYLLLIRCSCEAQDRKFKRALSAHLHDLRNTKWIPMFGYCDPNARDVVKHSKSVQVSKHRNPFGISIIK